MGQAKRFITNVGCSKRANTSFQKNGDKLKYNYILGYDRFTLLTGEICPRPNGKGVFFRNRYSGHTEFIDSSTHYEAIAVKRAHFSVRFTGRLVSRSAKLMTQRCPMPAAAAMPVALVPDRTVCRTRGQAGLRPTKHRNPSVAPSGPLTGPVRFTRWVRGDDPGSAGASCGFLRQVTGRLPEGMSGQMPDGTEVSGDLTADIRRALSGQPQPWVSRNRAGAWVPACGGRQKRKTPQLELLLANDPNYLKLT